MKDFKAAIQKLNRNSLPAHDLMEALATVFREEKLGLGREVFSKDIVPAFYGLKTSATSLFKDGKLFTKSGNKFSQLKNNAFEKMKMTVKVLPRFKKASGNLVRTISTDYKKCENDNEKLKYVSMLLLYTASLGAGARRGLFKPAIAPAFVAWILSATFIRTLERAKLKISPESPSHKVAEQLTNIAQLISSGHALGTAKIFKSNTNQKTNTPKDQPLDSALTGTRVDQWAYTAITNYFDQILNQNTKEIIHES